jgi:hypothetical protein
MCQANQTMAPVKRMLKLCEQRFLWAALATILCFGAAQAEGLPYKGPGGCNGSSCHGNTRAANEQESRIQGNEYAIWSARKPDGKPLDLHSGAFAVLGNERSKRMAKILDETRGSGAKIGDPQSSSRCLACHSLGSPQKSDGVSCEACHGLSTQWLGPHTQKNSHAASVQAGMIDTKDLSLRSKTCLECHLGSTKDKERVVDHELIAAGHPDLAFELDTFSAAMPMHWRAPKAKPGNTLPTVQVWAVGQSTALAEGMRLLATQAAGAWPEFTQLECYQCHHDLRADSWRIQRGYGGRVPGTLQPNTARFEVLRVLVEQAAGDRRAALDAGFAELSNLTNSKLGDAKGIEAAARSLQQQAEALTTRFAAQDFTEESARNIVKTLSTEAPRIAGAGVHSAEQVTMALDSLTAAYLPARAALQGSIDKLYNYLERPSVYQPSEFVTLFRQAAAQAAP